VYLESFLVQIFVLFFKIKFYFRKVVQIFEIKRVRGVFKGHQFTPLIRRYEDENAPNIH